MVKLVKGQDNVISFSITAADQVGEVYGTFIANGVRIPIRQSKSGTDIKITADDVAQIGEDFMIAVANFKNENDEELANIRIPIAVLPAGSDNIGFTDVRITLSYMKKVDGGSHGESNVKIFPTKDDFPPTGDVRYIYIAEDTGKTYYWDNSAKEYVEIHGVSRANLAEDDETAESYVLNRNTRYLHNSGWDGVHPYTAVSNFVSDYDSGKTYSANDVVFFTDEVKSGIFKCIVNGTTTPPTDDSRWTEIDLGNLIAKIRSYEEITDKPKINGKILDGELNLDISPKIDIYDSEMLVLKISS